MSFVILAATIASLAYLAIGLFRGDQNLRDPRWLLFCAVIFFGVLGNAIVCGALSAPRDRYQARVIWLVPLVALLQHERRRSLLAAPAFAEARERSSARA
jgi:hypothetical protein